jgi:hypothetical protein
MKVDILPRTKLGWWSVGLVVLMPVLFLVGRLFVGLYESVPAGETILRDVVGRPGVALSMLAGFASGIAAFVCGLITLIRGERAVLVFVSMVIGALLIVFLVVEVVFPH